MSIPTISNSTAPASDSRSAVKSSSGQTAPGASAGSRPAGNQGNASQARADAVSISTQAADLQALETSIRDLPEVNAARVTELRDKINAGQYVVDSGRLADKILAFEERF
ncbi:MAG: flagellar biosynthesis anti-sigma factor FlgM [Pseudohongiella sp.]|jgi:negative regulator of flagellin synthesis FlgM|nr:flagellar biosynthesis anti-sigma factor FlgM [Pseudohongiella sp.]